MFSFSRGGCTRVCTEDAASPPLAGTRNTACRFLGHQQFQHVPSCQVGAGGLRCGQASKNIAHPRRKDLHSAGNVSCHAMLKPTKKVPTHSAKRSAKAACGSTNTPGTCLGMFRLAEAVPLGRGLRICRDRCNQAGPRSEKSATRVRATLTAEEAAIQAVFLGISPCGPSGCSHVVPSCRWKCQAQRQKTTMTRRSRIVLKKAWRRCWGT